MSPLGPLAHIQWAPLLLVLVLVGLGLGRGLQRSVCPDARLFPGPLLRGPCVGRLKVSARPLALNGRLLLKRSARLVHISAR
jgi:hypothetical protein